MPKGTQPPIRFYECGDESVEARLDPARDAVWLTQRQIGKIFGASLEIRVVVDARSQEKRCP